MEVLSFLVGAWCGFFVVMWANEREESEKNLYQFLAFIPSAFSVVVAAWLLRQGIKVDATAAWLAGAFVAGIGAYLIQQRGKSSG